MTDTGLFGPDSVTWRIHSDPVMLLGGLRALFLQALHPQAMAGVADHSDFQDDPWGRFFRTVNYVTTVGFGTSAEARRAGARVRAVHHGLSGYDDQGVAYRVDDPHLLAWVHCSEVDSFLAAYRAAGGRVSRTDADRYVAEQSLAATLVGLDQRDVPQSTNELAEYFTLIRPELRMSPAAREAAKFVLTPPLPGAVRVLTPAWTGIAVTAFGLLPRWARALYGIPPVVPAGIPARVTATTLRRSVLLVPASVREAPPVRAARARAAGQPESVASRSAAALRVSSRLGKANRILSRPRDASA